MGGLEGGRGEERKGEREGEGRGEGVAESGEWVKGGIVATSRFKGAWEVGWICCVNRETLMFLCEFTLYFYTYSDLLWIWASYETTSYSFL